MTGRRQQRALARLPQPFKRTEDKPPADDEQEAFEAEIVWTKETRPLEPPEEVPAPDDVPEEEQPAQQPRRMRRATAREQGEALRDAMQWLEEEGERNRAAKEAGFDDEVEEIEHDVMAAGRLVKRGAQTLFRLFGATKDEVGE